MSEIDDRWLQDALRPMAGAPNAKPVSAELLLREVRRRRSRRRYTKAAAAGLGVTLLALVSLWPEEPARVARGGAKPPAGDIRVELARLERQAAGHQRIVDALLAASAPAPSPADESVSLHDGAAPPLWAAEAERTAAISWKFATMVESDFHDLAAAEREYRRLGDRFPGTAWALMAHESLRRLSSADGPASL